MLLRMVDTDVVVAINRSDQIWDDVATKRPRSETRLQQTFFMPDHHMESPFGCGPTIFCMFLWI